MGAPCVLTVELCALFPHSCSVQLLGANHTQGGDAVVNRDGQSLSRLVFRVRQRMLAIGGRSNTDFTTELGSQPDMGPRPATESVGVSSQVEKQQNAAMRASASAISRDASAVGNSPSSGPHNGRDRPSRRGATSTSQSHEDRSNARVVADASPGASSNSSSRQRGQVSRRRQASATSNGASSEVVAVAKRRRR